MKVLVGIIGIVVIVAAGMYSLGEQQPASASVPFEEIASGVTARVDTRVNYLISSTEGLMALWNLIDSSKPLPAVNFATHVVAAIFAGERASGGYGIHVVRVEDQSASRLVSVELTTPGEGCFVTQAITAPYQIIVLPKTEYEFSHVDAMIVSNCE